MSKRDKNPSAPPATNAEQHPQAAPAVRSVPLRSSKILEYHLNRLAVVYVRQSTSQQIIDHRESRERQYALIDHAAALGWRKERILLIGCQSRPESVPLSRPKVSHLVGLFGSYRQQRRGTRTWTYGDRPLPE